MKSHFRLLGIASVFVMATLGWLALSGITHLRMGTQSEKLRSSVQSLWGNEQSQRAPLLSFHYSTQEQVERVEKKDGVEVKVSELVTVAHERPVALASTNVNVAPPPNLWAGRGDG
jgi:hypothetical protein